MTDDRDGNNSRGFHSLKLEKRDAEGNHHGELVD